MTEAENNEGQDPAEEKPKAPAKGKKTKKCRVYRLGDNKHAPITVTVNDIRNKREFMPGQEVELTQQHIEALRNARIDSEIPVPDESGVYQASNPLHEAQRQNPSHKAEVDIKTGSIVLRRSEPLYSVEVL